MKQKKTLYLYLGAEDVYVKANTVVTRFTGTFAIIKAAWQMIRLANRDIKHTEYAVEVTHDSCWNK